MMRTLPFRIAPFWTVIVALAWEGLVLGATSANACGHATSIRRYGVVEGLSQSSVYAVLQDRRGFIWAATQDGLNRFDGHDFRLFRPDPRDPDSLGWGHLSSLIEDAEGRLWIGTLGGGLEVFDRATETFSRWRADLQDPTALVSDRIGPLAIARDGALWVGTHGGGLHRLDPALGGFRRFRQQSVKSGPTPDIGALPGDFVAALERSRNGGIWVGNERGLAYYRDDGTGGAWSAPELRNPRVTALHEDHEGGLWVGTFGGWLHHFP